MIISDTLRELLIETQRVRTLDPYKKTIASLQSKHHFVQYMKSKLMSIPEYRPKNLDGVPNGIYRTQPFIHNDKIDNETGEHTLFSFIQVKDESEKRTIAFILHIHEKKGVDLLVRDSRDNSQAKYIVSCDVDSHYQSIKINDNKTIPANKTLAEIVDDIHHELYIQTYTK